ncbi:MAG: 30S ribosome-binding factor RbfA [Planctomycetota bacterium]
MSQRKKQVESLLHRAVATVLQRGLADPRIKGLVSVTRVDASPDLKHAKVFVSVVPEHYESRTIHGLRDATMHVQRQVKNAVALRVVPHLRFEIDHDLKKQAAVFAAIDEGMQRTAERSPSPTHADAEQPRDEASGLAPTNPPTPPSENDPVG